MKKPCVTCEHCELQQPAGATEGVRTIDGKRVLPVCTSAVDPVTGAPREICDRERTLGACGPTGKRWVEREEVVFDPDEEDEFSLDTIQAQRQQEATVQQDGPPPVE